MKLETPDDQLMAMAAHRYCMGRSSYIVGSCLDWIKATWEQMQAKTQSIMLRDTLDDLHRYKELPYASDWQRLSRWMWERMDERQKSWLRDAVRHLPDAILIVEPEPSTPNPQGGATPEPPK